MCLMALNLVPKQSYGGRNARFNRRNNFSYVFATNEYKTKCIMEYFKKQFLKGGNKDLDSAVFRIRRQVEGKRFKEIMKSVENLPMMPVSFESDSASIEDFTGSLKVDFANKFIGGGALGNGCVQEEIMFANHPELYVSILLCEEMQDNEALFFSGFKKFFRNRNYGYQTEFNGEEPAHSYEGKSEYIVAIDAIDFKRNQMEQFREANIERELLKAYTGFSADESKTVATGNWGCGAFKGSVWLKFLVQWIACTMAGKKMIYCPYRSPDVIKNKHKI